MPTSNRRRRRARRRSSSSIARAVAPLVQRRDHREHDRDACRRVQARRIARSCVRSSSGRSSSTRMPRSPRNGLSSRGNRQIRQRLVAADVERADDEQALRSERPRDVAVYASTVPPRSARSSRSRNRNSDRSRPTPSAPSATTCSASARPPMFAATSTRWPSSVDAGSWRALSLPGRCRARLLAPGARGCGRCPPVEGAAAACPRRRRESTGGAVWQCRARAGRCRPRAECRAIARGSRRATKHRRVVVHKPSTCARFSDAVSDGVSSSATRIVFGGTAARLDVDARQLLQHAPADVAQVVCARGEQLVLQAREPVRVRA